MNTNYVEFANQEAAPQPETPTTEAPVNEAGAQQENPPAPQVDDTANEPTPFFKNPERGLDFENEDAFWGHFSELSEKANKEPEVKIQELTDPFAKHLFEHTSTEEFAALEQKDRHAKIAQLVKDITTDWMDIVPTSPMDVIREEMARSRAGIMTDEEIGLLLEEQYSAPEAPDEDDFDSDEAYQKAVSKHERAMKLHSAKMKNAAMEAARRLNEQRPQVPLGPTQEQIQERQQALQAQQEAYRNSGSQVLQSGLTYDLGEQEYNVVTYKDGKLTEDGEFLMEVMTDPNKALADLMDQNGNWNPKVVAEIAWIRKNLTKLVEAKAQGIAGNEINENLKNKRNATEVTTTPAPQNKSDDEKAMEVYRMGRR